VHLRSISALSSLYLPSISPLSPLQLPSISQASEPSARPLRERLHAQLGLPDRGEIEGRSSGDRVEIERLHAKLGLPLDRPLLRTCNALGGGGGGGAPAYLLRSPHEGLAPSGLAGGVISLVQGET